MYLWPHCHNRGDKHSPLQKLPSDASGDRLKSSILLASSEIPAVRSGCPGMEKRTAMGRTMEWELSLLRSPLSCKTLEEADFSESSSSIITSINGPCPMALGPFSLQSRFSSHFQVPSLNSVSRCLDLHYLPCTLPKKPRL